MLPLSAYTRKLRKAKGLSWSGTLYRWVNPDFPLPPEGPQDADCPTAGAFLFGGRSNARGLQPPLYTAETPWAAALEVARFSAEDYPLLADAAEAALETLHRLGYQLFALEAHFERALDARRYAHELPDLFAPWKPEASPCKEAREPKGSQAIGFAAFKLGFEAVLRPSSLLLAGWDTPTLLVDVFCPNLSRSLVWQELRTG